MPPDKLEVLKSAYDSLNEGDLEAALQFAADDFVIQRAGPDPSVQGKDDVRAFVAPDAFSEQIFEPLEFWEGEQGVFVWLTAHMKGASSGIAMEQGVAHVWQWRDGLVISLTVTFDRREGLEIAGLSEAAL